MSNKMTNINTLYIIKRPNYQPSMELGTAKSKRKPLYGYFANTNILDTSTSQRIVFVEGPESSFQLNVAFYAWPVCVPIL